MAGRVLCSALALPWLLRDPAHLAAWTRRRRRAEPSGPRSPHLFRTKVCSLGRNHARVARLVCGHLDVAVHLPRTSCGSVQEENGQSESRVAVTAKVEASSQECANRGRRADAWRRLPGAGLRLQSGERRVDGAPVARHLGHPPMLAPRLANKLRARRGMPVSRAVRAADGVR